MADKDDDNHHHHHHSHHSHNHHHGGDSAGTSTPDAPKSSGHGTEPPTTPTAAAAASAATTATSTTTTSSSKTKTKTTPKTPSTTTATSSSSSSSAVAVTVAVVKTPLNVPYNVKVVIKSAQGLAIRDMFTRKADPYVIAAMFEQIEKTKKIKRTLDPEWNQEFIFEPYDLTSDSMLFEVWDWERFIKDEPMGKCHWDLLPLTTVPVGQPVPVKLALSKINPKDKDVSGELHCEFSLVPVALPSGWKSADSSDPEFPVVFTDSTGECHISPPSIAFKNPLSPTTICWYTPCCYHQGKREMPLVETDYGPKFSATGGFTVPHVPQKIFLVSITGLEMSREGRLVIETKSMKFLGLVAPNTTVVKCIQDFFISLGIPRYPFVLRVPQKHRSVLPSTPAKLDIFQVACQFVGEDPSATTTREHFQTMVKKSISRQVPKHYPASDIQCITHLAAHSSEPFPKIVSDYLRKKFQPGTTIADLVQTSQSIPTQFKFEHVVIPSSWSSCPNLAYGLLKALTLTRGPYKLEIEKSTTDQLCQDAVVELVQGPMTCLTLSNVTLGQNFAASLCQCLVSRTLPLLTSVDLSVNNLGSDGVISVLKGLSGHTCLQHLDLHATQCNSSILPALDCLQTRVLKFLDISSNPFKNDDGANIVALIGRSLFLKELHISNSLMKTGCILNAIADSKIKLKRLSLQGTTLTEGHHSSKTGEGILDTLRQKLATERSLSSLKMLSIDSNHIVVFVPALELVPPKAQICLIVHAVSDFIPFGVLPPSVNELHVIGNGTPQLMTEFARAAVIPKVVIQGCTEATAAPGQIASLLSKGITHLDISNSKLNLASIAEAVRVSKTLTYLDVSNNTCPATQTEVFVQNLIGNRSLTELKLDRNDLTPMALNSLQLIVKCNKKLTHFVFPEFSAEKALSDLKNQIAAANRDLTELAATLQFLNRTRNISKKPSVKAKIRSTKQAMGRAQRMSKKLLTVAPTISSLLQRNISLAQGKLQRKLETIDIGKAVTRSKKRQNSVKSKQLKQRKKLMKKIRPLFPAIQRVLPEGKSILQNPKAEVDVQLYWIANYASRNKAVSSLLGKKLILKLWRYICFWKHLDKKLAKLCERRDYYCHDDRGRAIDYGDGFLHGRGRGTHLDPPPPPKKDDDDSADGKSSDSEDDQSEFDSDDCADVDDHFASDDDGQGSDSNTKDSDPDGDDANDNDNDTADIVDMYGSAGPQDLPDGSDPNGDAGSTCTLSSDPVCRTDNFNLAGDEELATEDNKAQDWVEHWRQQLLRAATQWPIPVPEFREEFMFLRSTLPRTENEVTIATQLSLDRLHNLEEMALSWTGIISAAIYLPLCVSSDPEALEYELDRIKSLHQGVERLNVDSSPCRLDIALVFQLPETDTVCEVTTNPETSSQPYPINVLRNVAMRQVHTNYVFVLDVDFVPSTGMHGHLCSVLYGSTRDSKTALVLPAFELSLNKTLPNNKLEAVKMMSLGSLSPFHTRHFPMGHMPSNYDTWKIAQYPYLATYEEGYEPYVVVPNNSTPLFDPRFCGYGLNKIQWLLHLAVLGWKFQVDPFHFVVSRPHPRSCAWTATYGAKKTVHYFLIKALYDKFKRELLEQNTSPCFTLRLTEFVPLPSKHRVKPTPQNTEAACVAATPLE
ncbi:Glycosyltransferase LARGE2 [Pelomyxa schiedti]|nr:Glycosyltransferase LARGE2 [Pelomyxa schiedti]